MARRRVAMVIQAFAVVGGAEQQLASLAPALERAGTEVHIITRRRPGLPARSTIPGATVHAVGGTGGRVRASLTYTVSALRLLRRLQPDVVHCHDLFSPATIACLAGTLTGAGVVAKPNTGGSFGNVERLRSRPFGPLRLAWYRRAVDAFVVISDEIDAELRELGVADSRRARVPNGVDLTRFHPATVDERLAARADLAVGEGPVVAYTGRFARQKGTDVLLRAWPHVIAVRPDAHLFLAGTPRDPDVPSWDTDQPGVTLLGPLADVAPVLRAADVYVNPSRGEGLSNSLLEALAAGVPVVVTDVGGTRELVRHEVDGLLVPADDPAALAAALVRAFDDPARSDWVAAGRSVAAEHSLEAVAGRLIEVYERVRPHGRG